METNPYHTLNDLFAQLGLGSDDAEIETFLAGHRLQDDEKLAGASFWSEGQRRFLLEALEEDSDWCEVVDTLDSLLRH